MFSFILTNFSRKVLWLALAVIFSVFLMFQLFGAIVKRATSTTGSASMATARVTVAATDSYAQYKEDNAMMASSSMNRSLAAAAEDEDDLAVEKLSDIFLYPAAYIAANGHKVEITGQTVLEGGTNAKTSIWIDENDDNRMTKNEIITLRSSVMSSIYIFGGFDTIQSNGNICHDISITMTGGEVGAIFAGGYYQNVIAQKYVDIKILGGSVHYVDCGSLAGPLNERLTTGSISVYLKNCRYRSNTAINLINKTSFNCPNVSVFDFSDHRNRESYACEKPIFTNYIAKISKNRYILGGNITLPSDLNLKADKLVLEGAIVNNLGKVSVPSCSDIHMLDGAVWTGNAIDAPHQEGDVTRYDYSSHTRVCKTCRQTIVKDHVWSYSYIQGQGHTKTCGVCNYSYLEPCTNNTIYNSSLITQTACVYCGHTDTPIDKTYVGEQTCNHPTASAFYLTRSHYDRLPDAQVNYSIQHTGLQCQTCKALLPFTMNYGGKNILFRDLSAASRFVKKNSIKVANITMVCDAFGHYDRDSLYTNASDTINLDMNGCDMIDRSVVLYSGNIDIKNKKFGTNHYAFFNVGENFVSKPAAKVSIEGCFIPYLEIYDWMGYFTLKNVMLDYLDVDDLSRLKIEGKVVIRNNKLRVNLDSKTVSDFLPSGYVIKECMSDGTWIRRYDHASALPIKMGPLCEMNKSGEEKTGSLAIVECDQHVLNKATSPRNSIGQFYHEGNCIYCKKLVAMEHDMLSGVSYSDSIHTKKCLLCSYKNGSAHHDYDGEGNCVVCGAKAPVSVHGHYSPSKVYFSSFDEAFLAVNSANLYDTITLKKDQVYHLNDTLDEQQITFYRFTKNTLTSTKTYVYSGPHIHVAGGKYTLSNAGSITIPDNMSLYALEMSGDTSSVQYHATKFKIKAAPGYIMPKSIVIGGINKFGDLNLNKIYPCPHGSYSYEKVTDQNSKYMVYHKKICSTCGHTDNEKHTYSNGICSDCGVSSSSAYSVRVTSSRLASPRYYTSLVSAWNYAVQYSHTYRTPYTIQIMSDIQLNDDPNCTSESNGYLTIPSEYNLADVILDATDDEGNEHTVTGWSKLVSLRPISYTYADYLMKIDYGHLTILSGNYFHLKRGIMVNSNKNLTLKGGTFQGGKYVANLENDILYCDKNLLLCIADGYVLVTQSKGTGVVAGGIYSNQIQDKRGAIITQTKTIKGGNGYVVPCPHPLASVYEAEAPTCITSGVPAQLYCRICGYYLDQESGQKATSKFKTDALGHAFKENGKYCDRCGIEANGVTLRLCRKNGSDILTKKYTGLFEAWNAIPSLSSSAESDSYFVITLCADETMPKGTIFNSISSHHDVVIDLNGHNLDLGESVNLASRLCHVTITDSQNTGESVLSADINQSSSDIYFKLILDGVTLKPKSFYCNDLAMINRAGISFDGGPTDNLSIQFQKVSMEPGCWMEGIGMSSFMQNGVLTGSVYDYDAEDVFLDMNHHVHIEQQNSKGQWIDAYGSPYFRFNTTDTNKRTADVVSKYNGKERKATTCYRWYAERLETDHDINYNGRYCDFCRQNTHQYKIFDGTNYYESSTAKYRKVSYSRGFKKSNVWEPLYLPMSIAPGVYTDVCDIADIYSFGQLYDTNGDGKLDAKDETWLIVDLMKEGVTDPYYPYLIRSKNSGEFQILAVDSVLLEKMPSEDYTCSTSHTNYTFSGTTSLTVKNTYSDDMFVLDQDGKLSLLKYGGDIKPLRWSIKTSQNGTGYNRQLQQAQANGIRVMVIGEDLSEETAIQLLKGETIEVNLDGLHYTLDGRKATHTQSGIQVLNGKTIMIK